jgi:hypothetical protein
MRLLALLMVLLLAGCAGLRPGAGEAVQMSEVVGAAVTASRAATEEQRRQLNLAQQQFAVVQDDMNRLRLATLLATLPAPLRDDARAAALLEPLAARRPETVLVQFAGLLAAGAAERQKLTRDLRATEKREEELTRDLRTTEKREEAAEERANTLRQQMDALKSIERGILEREERRRATNR